MNINERIRRRLERDRGHELLRDAEALSPVSHPDEPVGRGPALERLLDQLSPAFEGRLPADSYLFGPKGSGKSAVVTSLVDRLQTVSKQSRRAIGTTTRSDQPRVPRFVYVDARHADTEARFYRSVLQPLAEEEATSAVGLGADTLQDRLRALETNVGLVVAVDHLGEPEGLTLAAVDELLEPLDAVSRLGIGRESPDSLEIPTDNVVEFSSYRRHALVDVLTERASDALAPGALGHDASSRVAEWADGDAHDALTALLVGALSTLGDEGTLSDSDLSVGMADVPRPCVSLGRVLALSETRQRILLRLVDLDGDARETVSRAASAIAEDLDLSASTVKRHLYELAEMGITNHVTVERADRRGRPPSRVEPAFPTRAFRYLCSAEVPE